MSDPSGASGFLGTDPLDVRVPRPPTPRRRGGWFGGRLALGLSAAPASGLLLAFGLALGPEGVNLLSRGVLSELDALLSAALAGLGLLIGLEVDWRRSRERRFVGIASLEASLTLLLVGAGVLLVGLHDPGVMPEAVFVALAVGICAAASSTATAADPTSLGGTSSRISDLDDVLPVVAGGVALAAFRAGSLGGTLWLAMQSLVLAAAPAIAGWLLLSREASDSEQHVFTAGLVLLLGGVGSLVGGSSLFFGLVAGVVFGVLRDVARDRIVRDVRYVRHPLLVLLLLVAGARVTFTPVLLLLMLVYVALRTAGKLATGSLLGRLAPARHAWDLGRSLISPGVLASAFALDVGRAGADPAGLVLAVAVTGSVFSELIALVFHRPEKP